jgi:hypothetical protein
MFRVTFVETTRVNLCSATYLSLGGAVVELFISWYVDWMWRFSSTATKVTALYCVDMSPVLNSIEALPIRFARNVEQKGRQNGDYNIDRIAM